MKTHIDPHIDPEWMDLELEHKYAGDGFGILEIYENEWCRAMYPRGVKESSNRAFLLWTKLLKPMVRRQDPKDLVSPKVLQPFSPEDTAKLHQARADLASGKKKVVSTHIVET